MQNYFRDHDFVPMNSELAKDVPELMSSKLAMHERPVLRGSVIAESEQDLAELLSRYQQGYYRPNEAAVALLPDQMDPSKYLLKGGIKETCGLKEGLQDASRNGGSMMQLQHVAKARLLMRHPSSQYNTNSSQTCSNAQIPRSVNTRDLQFRTSLNSNRMPFSFQSIVHPDRTQFQDLSSGSYQNGGMMMESHWTDSMSSGGGLDWSQKEGDYTGQGFGVESGLLDPYNSNSYFGNQLRPISDFPMSSVISKNPHYHSAQSPYQSMIPNPSSFQNSRDWNDPFRSLDAPFGNPGSFLDSRMESLSAQQSTRSSQDRVTSFNCYGTEDNAVGSNFEFLDQLLSPETVIPTRTAPVNPTRSRMTRQSRSRKQIPVCQTPGISDDNTGGSDWLLETLARLPVDADQSESCLIWNNEPAESFLLSTENSFNEKSCSTDLRSENNNHPQSEASKLLEQTGLNFQDPACEVDISHKLSDILANSQLSEYSKEDVLELAFCTLGKWTASVEDLQNVCKVLNTSVSKVAPGEESFTEELQFQTSLESWLGLKHVQSFSRGNQGLRSIQNTLQKDRRFVQQEDNLWSCVNPLVDRQDSTREVSVKAAKRKSNDNNKSGMEFSKRKKNDSELQYSAEGYNRLVNDSISHYSIEVSNWDLFERSRFQQ